ncbi:MULTISPECIES: APC family permease [Clostridia]|uniref:APC family permease n=1 Tax=Clostridia TaxID=186801 RepID=UPI000EA020B2|nr:MULTISPECIES: APC family permease [Clostridia]NBJ71642.1 APC family permease [Roseburia sp. 1XD42-34]RKI73989.1 APC family permease [Clostridium sp. 1xD42-85]
MRNKLNRFDILSLVLGSIIGWGAFTLPGIKFLPESGVINTTIGLLLGGFAIIFIQKGYHIMMQQHAEDGGGFSYTYKNLGRGHGFIVGWALILCYLSIVPLNATAFVLIVKILFGSNIEWLYLYEIAGYPVYFSEVLIASSVLILFAALNIRGLRKSSNVQNVMVLCLMINIAIVFIAMLLDTGSTTLSTNYFYNYDFDIGEIAKVVAIIPFLFVGFDIIPQVASQLKFKPEKATWIAILSVFSGVVAYSLLNVITALAFSPEQTKQLDWALGEAVLIHVGSIGFILLVIALMTAVSGGINGFMISSSHLLSSLSAYKLCHPKYMKRTNAGVPINSVFFITGISLLAPWFGREVIIYIVDMSSFLAAVAYLYVCFISYKQAASRWDQLLTFTGIIISISFILLLITPQSPGQLSTPSLIFMGLWGIAGLFYYRSYTKKVAKQNANQ